MSSPVKNSHGMWLTRLTVPADLRPIIKKRELKRSLKTKNEREARLKHPIVLAEFQAVLECARRTLENDSLLTDAVAQSIIFDWRRSVANTFSASDKAVNPYLNNYAGSIEENNLPVLMVLDDLSLLNDKVEKARSDGNELDREVVVKGVNRSYKQLNTLLADYLLPSLSSFQIEPNLDSSNYRKLLYDFAIAYVKITESAVKRKISNNDLLKHGAMSLEVLHDTSSEGISVEELWEEYKRSLAIREPDRAKARIRDYSIAMKKFLQVYSHRAVSTIKKRDIAKFRLLLEQLPTRPNKAMKALPLEQQIEKSNEEGLPRSTASSIKNQINAISAVFTYGVSQDYIDVNPVQGTVSDIKTRRTTQEGKGFSNEELTVIFRSKLFHENYRPVKADYGEAVYWIPLLLYYTGARVEEVAQLYIADIDLEHDIPNIRIHGERDDQSVKTGESRRVPLHNHLLSLGFASYVEGLSSSGRLFPKLTNTGTEGKYNTGVRVWFGKYLRDIKISHAGMKPMHDFRHSFITGCRDRNARIDVQRSITGHSQPDVASQYGSYSLENMSELIQAIPNCFGD